MDAETEGQMEGWADLRMDEQTYLQECGEMDRWINGMTDTQTERQTGYL